MNLIRTKEDSNFLMKKSYFFSFEEFVDLIETDPLFNKEPIISKIHEMLIIEGINTAWNYIQSNKRFLINLNVNWIVDGANHFYKNQEKVLN